MKTEQCNNKMIDKETIKHNSMIVDMRKTNPKKWKNDGFSVWVNQDESFGLQLSLFLCNSTLTKKNRLNQ